MKYILSLLTTCFLMRAFALSQTGPNYVVMIDENGNPTDARLATKSEADLISGQINQWDEDFKSFSDALSDAQETIDLAVRALDYGESDGVVYREGFVDSFSAMAILSSSARVSILSFERDGSSQTNINGVAYQPYLLTYGFNEQVGALTPVIKISDTVTGVFEALDSSLVSSPQAVSARVINGITYVDCYQVRVFMKAERTGFIRVLITGDSSTSETASLELVGGVKGGANFSGVITPQKSYRLVITGGVVTTFEEAGVNP